MGTAREEGTEETDGMGSLTTRIRIPGNAGLSSGERGTVADVLT